MLGHRIHGCPAAEEYYRTGRVKIIGNRLHLPTGEPIPNDGHGLGLKASLDAWLAANVQPSSDTTMPAPQHDPPPHMISYSFEIVPQPAVPTGAYITEEADSDTGSDDNVYTTELYDMYEVFAAKKKDSTPLKAPTSAAAIPPPPPPAPTTRPAPSTSTSRPPQYRYQASAEDQALTKELIGCIFEGKLDRITPAHIFAASSPVRKEVVECLRSRRVETASFEQADGEEMDPVSVLRLATRREAKFSLPLREIDVLVNSRKTEAVCWTKGPRLSSFAKIWQMKSAHKSIPNACYRWKVQTAARPAHWDVQKTWKCALVTSLLPSMLMLSEQHHSVSFLDDHSTTFFCAD